MMDIRGKLKKFTDSLALYMKQGVAPREIAFAVAIGTFIAFIPMVGVHTALAFLCAFVLRINPLIVLLGTQISNPLTFPIQLFVSAQAGNIILHGSLISMRFASDTDWVNTYIIPLIMGSIVLGIIGSFAAYGGAYFFMRKRMK